MQSRSTSTQITTQEHSRAELDSLRATYTSQAHNANLVLAAGAGLGVLSAVFFVLHF
jgi:hypothetical protein